MSQVYVHEHGAVIGVRDGRLEINSEEVRRSIPFESVDGISIFGNSQVSTACMKHLLKHGIATHFYSSTGTYFGRLISTGHTNAARQKAQILASCDENLCLEFSKSFIEAKLHNQYVLLRRYRGEKDISTEASYITMMRGKIAECKSIAEIMGCEGTAARYYYKALGKLVKNEFYFEGRTRRPPLDPFNSMLSLGYSILLNEVFGAIESVGLNPYFGLLHSEHDKMPALACDLMEEWRPVIVDSTVMALVSGNEISIDEFYEKEERQGVFLTKEGFSIFIKKLEMKMHSKSKYLDYVEFPISLRTSLNKQALRIVKALEESNPKEYTGVRIR